MTVQQIDPSNLRDVPQSRQRRRNTRWLRGMLSPHVWLETLRRRPILASALFGIGLPTLAAVLYFGLIASDRFAVEVRLAIRGQESTSTNALGLLGGLAGGAGQFASDSYIVVDYVKSRSAIDQLMKDVDLRRIYSNEKGDWFSRFPPTYPIERFLQYWQTRVNASYEPSTGIVRIEVSAFTPQDALTVAQQLTSAAERLVNQMSEAARHDSLRAVTSEVERAEERQRLLRTAVRQFREREQISDPVRRAGFQQEMIERAKAELSRIDTEMQNARRYMKEDAPIVSVLKNQRATLLQQIDSLQREIGSGRSDDGARKGTEIRSGPVASMLYTYEELEAERAFAEKAYLTALASLERARFEADRQQRYLALFVQPALPEEAKYPQRIEGIAVTLVVSSLLWSLAVLIVLGVRDHL